MKKWNNKHGSPTSKSFIKKNEEVKKINKSKNSKKEIFYDAGQFYWYNLNSKIKKKCGYKIDAIEGIDVNTIEDFKYLKKLYLLRNKK